MKVWKPTIHEKRAIRAVAAASENRKPQSIHIEVGERYSLTRAGDASTNMLLVGGFEDSDLNQPVAWTELDLGVPLTSEGRAVVDFYVYEKLVGDHGDLLTNVQAHVVTLYGKPHLVRITGTGMPDVFGDALNAFTLPPQKRAMGVGASAILAWKQEYKSMWAR